MLGAAMESVRAEPLIERILFFRGRGLAQQPANAWRVGKTCPLPLGERCYGWLFALCACALAAGLVCQPFPPCVDYPQHLAVAHSLRRLFQGHEGGELVLLSYNGLFELATAVLGLILPLELAGRIVLGIGFGLQPLAVWRLVRFAGRPAAYAFAWLPFAYSFCLSWGFVNFVMAAGLATASLLAWFEKRPAALVLLLSLVTAYAHVLGAGFVLLGMGLGVAARVRPPRALLPGLVLGLYVALAHAQTDTVPRLARDWIMSFPRWTERLTLSNTLLGSWSGTSDEWLAAALGLVLVATCLGALVARRQATWSGHGFMGLTGAAWLLYAVLPLVFDDCWSFFQRFGHVGVLWLPATLPTFSRERRWRHVPGAALALLGVLATVNFVRHISRDAEAADARAILAAIPRGSHVAPVNYDRSREPLTDAMTWHHFAAYAVVRRDSEIPDMFVRDHWTFPVRESWPDDVPLPPPDYQWQSRFDVDADYARYFDVVLARTSDAKPHQDPRRKIFGAAQSQATLLERRGRFWLYRFVPKDGVNEPEQADTTPTERSRRSSG